MSTATPPTAAQIGEFVRKAGITLPASAQPIGWRELRGIDDALWDADSGARQ
jgi:hypothetical protein